MLEAMYTGLSGLATFSKGLDVISNNVSNVNTPGFKRNEMLFRDALNHEMLGQNANGQIYSNTKGNGVTDDGTLTRFAQGDLRSTGNDTDMALKGRGFFILEGKNGRNYTRAGQFVVDKDGYLVTKSGALRVLGMDARGGLTPIQIGGYKSQKHKQTEKINFIKNLTTDSLQHKVDNVVIYDSNGQKHTWSFTFTKNQSSNVNSIPVTDLPNSSPLTQDTTKTVSDSVLWTVDIVDDKGNSVYKGGEVRFNKNGTPARDYNKFTLNYAPDGATPSSITISMGDAESFSGATSYSDGTVSSLAFEKQDGYAYGSLSGTSVQIDGRYKFNYSNGQQIDGPQIALAEFGDAQVLRSIGDALFVAEGGSIPIFGVAGKDGMGDIEGGNIELSNVDLTSEFGEMIIVQRGYQASSQVLTAANEMLQQLIDMGKSR